MRDADPQNHDRAHDRTTDRFDTPWKELMESHLPAFFELFFPEIHRSIDWSRGWKSLDKELRKITRDAQLGKRLADKLVQVYGLDGTPRVVLIHIEIQGQVDAHFAERMFVYNYRVHDRYRRPVVSVAVLGDESANWRPDYHGWDLWGCQMGLRFPSVKLRDYNEKRAELEAESNPFATAVLAHLETMATQGDPRARFRSKLALIRRLYVRGYERQDVLDLFAFIDWMMTLPRELESQIHEEVEKLEEELQMPYVTTIERFGMQRGIEQGMQRGMTRGAAKTLRRLLARRFETLPAWVDERLETAEAEQLEAWTDRLLDARSLDEVFAGS